MNLNLTNLFRDKMKKEKLGSESALMPTYDTGFNVLDYRNGSSEDNIIRTGVDGGKIVYVIGRSGTGKSSLVIQSACNIVNPFENSQILHFDAERASSRSRIRNITGWDKDKFNSRYIHLEENITSESFFKTIKAMADLKIENYDLIKMPTGETNFKGEPVYALPPTVAILDSLALLTPEKIDNEDELSGQMSATAIARANASVFKRIMNSLRRANIILYVVNHINTKIDINPMAKTQAQVNYLKQDETLPGK